MKTETRSQRLEVSGQRPAARSVLECGSPLPLFPRHATPPIPPESARGLAHSKTWRQFVAATRQSAALLLKASHRRFPKRRYTVLALLLSTILSQLSTAHAQNYSIDWQTIDGGGGGTSTGGVYSVSGTIGQPDAGKMSGGQYSVTGGFWALYAVIQMAGAPTLTIVPAGAGLATISWMPNTPGFVLQETLSLSPTNWVNSASGSINPITVPATLPTKFYRLSKP